MLRLALYGAALWAAYRAGQAVALGIPVTDALLAPLKPIRAVATAAARAGTMIGVQ